MKYKKIKDFENYSVSEYGDIRNDKTGRILKKHKDKNGYEYVNLYENGKRKRFMVHRLVAIAFISNPNNLPCVDHIIPISNGGTNSIDNLRWCTQKENCNNPSTLENYSKAMKEEKHPRCRKIICITTGEVFDYIRQASKKYGVLESNICKCCKGKIKSAGKLNDEKLVWRYLRGDD